MRVLVADDLAVYRQGLIQLLVDVDVDVESVEADSFRDALDRVADSGPFDLVLVDLALPDSDPFDGLTALCRRLPDCPVVALSASEDPADVRRAIACGAQGYALKSARSEVLYHVILLVLAGEIYVPPIVLARGAAQHGPIDKLTPRECEVLGDLTDGLSNKQIAQHLAIGEGTVKVHLKSVLRKLEVANRTQAATLAMRLGWQLASDPLADKI